MTLKINTQEIKQAGERIVLQIIQLGSDECMTVADVAEMLDVGLSTIREHIRSHGLFVRRADEHQLAELKKQGVLPLKTPTANLLPKETIKALVKIVNTPNAWAAYNQLWQDIEKPTITKDQALVEMAKAVRTASDMTLMVNERVEQVAASLAGSTLSTDQISGLTLAMSQRATTLGLHGRQRFMATGRMKGDLKTKFLPPKTRSVMTFKDISLINSRASLYFD